MLEKILIKYKNSRLGGRGLAKIKWLKRIYDFFVYLFRLNLVKVDGRKMFFDSVTYIYVEENGGYEPLETAVVKKEMKKGDTAVDIGANAGYYTLLFSETAGETGHVYAFEPENANYRLLEKNIRLNKAANVSIEKAEVSDTNGFLTFYKSAGNAGGHSLFNRSAGTKTVMVKAFRLDDYPALKEARIDFIKIDVQGAEPAALAGMKKILRRSRKLKILMEFSPYDLALSGFKPEAPLVILNRYGFVFYDIEKKKKTGIKELLRSYPAAKEKYTNLLCKKAAGK